MDEAVGPDGQVQPVANRVQVAEGRALTHTVNYVEGQGPDTRGVGAVVVGAVAKSRVPRRLVEGALVGRPLILGVSAAPDGAVGAVELVPEVLVGLHPLEVRENLFERPLVVAPFGPAVVVFADSAEELGVVDRARAARNLAPRDVHVDLGSGPGAEVPDVVGVVDGPSAVGKLDFFGHAVEFWEITTGF